MKGRMPPRRNREQDDAARRRDLIERSIVGHGPEAVATRKRLQFEANQAAAPAQPKPPVQAPVAPPATQEPGRTAGSAEGERAAVQDDEQRQAAAQQSAA